MTIKVNPGRCFTAEWAEKYREMERQSLTELKAALDSGCQVVLTMKYKPNRNKIGTEGGEHE